MGYQPLEDLLPKAGNSIYRLVRLASNRALELADGRKKLVELPAIEKTTTVALEEIKEAKVVLKQVAEQFKPKETEKKKVSKKAEGDAIVEEAKAA